MLHVTCFIWRHLVARSLCQHVLGRWVCNECATSLITNHVRRLQEEANIQQRKPPPKEE